MPVSVPVYGRVALEQPLGGGGGRRRPAAAQREEQPVRRAGAGIGHDAGGGRLASVLRTVAGDGRRFSSRYSAAAPATCGVAIEVPLMVLVAVLLVCHAEVMVEPGAKMSRQVPKLENEERASDDVVEPTVIGVGGASRREVAGVRVVVAGGDGVGDAGVDGVATALSIAVMAPPPRLMLATAGWPAGGCR